MKNNRILLVEDNPIHREVIYDGLEEAGYDVRKAQNIDEARKVLMEFTPDLFILDIVIGTIKRQGILFAEEMYNTKGLRHVPVLFISAHLDEKSIVDHIPEYLKGNILPKPFDFDQLINKIRDLLR